MMEKARNVPVLRFPDFRNEWDRMSLGEVVEVKSQKFNPVKETTYVKCIELEHLASGTGQLLGFVNGQYSGSIKNKFNKGDVLFGKLRPYLKKFLLASFEGVCSSEIWVLKSKRGINDFLYYIIQSNAFIDLANISTGSKMPRADWNIVSKGFFNFPSLPEQQKIAAFLTAVDDKIQQLTKKKALLEQYKKGLMQQLFSQNLRFKDDQGNAYPGWEENSLGDIAAITMGQSPDSASYNGDGEGIPLIQGNADMEDHLTLPRNWTTEPTKVCIPGDLILTVRAPVGSIGKSLHDACLGRGVCSIRNNEFSTVEFLYQFLLEYEPKWGRLEQGSTFTAVSGADIRSIDLLVPCIEEQTKIANFLSAIDEKINGVIQQIEHARQFKKGLLQQMFV